MGINFTLFNTERKKITTGRLALINIGDSLAMVQVEGGYDISGDFVAFVFGGGEENKRLPVLYRIVIDGATGKLKSEDVMEELPQVSMGDAYGMYFGDTDVPTFFWRKTLLVIIMLLLNIIRSLRKLKTVFWRPIKDLIIKCLIRRITIHLLINVNTLSFCLHMFTAVNIY